VASLSESLEAAKAEAVANKQKEALEAESRLIAKEHEAASSAVANAAALRDAASDRLVSKTQL
jgi:hypothetical protein